MQPSGHSSLPLRPQWTAPQQQQPYPNPAAMQNYFQQSAYSSHYAQAYMQAQGIQPAPLPLHASTRGAYTQSGPSSRPSNNTARQPRNAQPTGSWYQPGHSRCSYKNCRFTGAPKALEIHMMDRHLIFPPGWDRKAKKDEWDADPSLKGCAYSSFLPSVIVDRSKETDPNPRDKPSLGHARDTRGVEGRAAEAVSNSSSCGPQKAEDGGGCCPWPADG
jgi:hypothetical protein